MTWQPGRDKIAELLDAAELQQVTADHRVAQLLLADAGRHLATAAAALSSGDLSGAYQLAYDALRKSAASLLAVQGLRATSRGGHIAIQEAAQAQFGSTVRAFRSFGRIRRARNNFEYPSTLAPGPSPDDVRDAIAGHLRERGEAVGIAQLGGFEEPGARLAESPRLHFARGQVLCRVTVAGVRGEHRRLAAGFAAGDSISTSSMGWTSRSPMVAASVTWIALVRLVHRGLTNLVRPPRSPRRTRQPRLLDRYWFYLGH